MSSRRLYYVFVGFIYGLGEKNWKSEVFVFAVSRLPLTSCLNSLLSQCMYFGGSAKSIIESYIFYLFSSYVTDFAKKFEVV